MWQWITSSDQQSSRQCSPIKSVSGFSPAFMMYAMSAPGEIWPFASRANTLHEAQRQPIISVNNISHSCSACSLTFKVDTQTQHFLIAYQHCPERNTHLFR